MNLYDVFRSDDCVVATGVDLSTARDAVERHCGTLVPRPPDPLQANFHNYPKIIAGLIWWNEPPEWLAACVASLASFCDHIVALDGAYSLHPNGTPQSPQEQVEAIKSKALECRIEATVVQRSEMWEGQEQQKRSALFQIMEPLARPFVDWYLTIDADELASTPSPLGLRVRLAEMKADVGQVHFGEDRWMRRAFRAIPGLHATSNHTFAAPGGRVFGADGSDWDNSDEQLGISVDHWKHDAHPRERLADKWACNQLQEAFDFLSTDPEKRGLVPDCAYRKGRCDVQADGCEKGIMCGGTGPRFEHCWRSRKHIEDVARSGSSGTRTPWSSCAQRTANCSHGTRSHIRAAGARGAATAARRSHRGDAPRRPSRQGLRSARRSVLAVSGGLAPVR